MTDIYTDKHGLHRAHGLGELHLIQITASLAIDLPQYIARLTHIERATIATSNHLRRYLVHLEHLLNHLVVTLSVQHADGNLRVAEARIL